MDFLRKCLGLYRACACFPFLLSTPAGKSGQAQKAALLLCRPRYKRPCPHSNHRPGRPIAGALGQAGHSAPWQAVVGLATHRQTRISTSSKEGKSTFHFAFEPSCIRCYELQISTTSTYNKVGYLPKL